ncbi:hypothetical protein OG2516_14576 [Oceanicola granulosus HTCC2516]|uniref:KANL3/Tex30 alpha/beta hydrolase-like domain-containing protein n=1 Tax=Oceanicola granulosus (strain ATCC BAA-861 / DSM 15982 / KCTC 12143 / HTCC2516) TaxID=314256 RepID=Q2CEW2_OCEGH|nr:alpha/beta family hydrolase [Oceanicola granulosus]EAR51248.1 hypothetical protein OG2516_14576 [Oceanicola granulosus HTCC2516]
MILTGPTDARATLLLGHGAGAPMDAPWMNDMADALAAEGLRVARFEFAYMAARREGRRRPPRAESLRGEYLDAVAALGADRLVVGGKSMGGRVASMVADELVADGRAAGLVCLGYPFHPPGKPEALRTAHLESLRAPALICQGTRDAFGTADEVPGYALSERVELFWLEDGDHELKPRKRVTGKSLADHQAAAAARIAAWLDGLP